MSSTGKAKSKFDTNRLAQSVINDCTDEQLTHRQKEVLSRLANGLSNKEIAEKLNCSVKTIDAHRAAIMTRLRIHDLAGLVKYAIKTGLTTLD